MGFILNRPAGPAAPIMRSIPVFLGGPVQQEQMIMTSIQWRDNPDTVAFRTFVEMPTEEDIAWESGLRIFAGYAGWSPGQLEQELETHAWVVMPPNRDLIEMFDPHSAWKRVMREAGPALHLLSEAPEKPGLN